MEHSQIQFPNEIGGIKASTGVPTILLWLVSLAVFQPVGFVVISAIIGSMAWPTGGTIVGIMIGLCIAIWARGKYIGAVRASETQRLRGGERS